MKLVKTMMHFDELPWAGIPPDGIIHNALIVSSVPDVSVEFTEHEDHFHLEFEWPDHTLGQDPGDYIEVLALHKTDANSVYAGSN